MYTYKNTEPGLYTVGHYEKDKWIPEKDLDSEGDAAARVAWLNGGAPPKAKQQVMSLGWNVDAENEIKKLIQSGFWIDSIMSDSRTSSRIIVYHKI